MRITNPLTLLQRPSSELRPDCHSSAGRRWNRGRDRLYLQVLANCAEAWGSPPKKLVRWRGATEGRRAGRRGTPQPTPMGTGRHSGPGEFQLTGGAASSPSKTSPTPSGWTSTWRGTEWVCQSGGPPGSEKKPISPYELKLNNFSLCSLSLKKQSLHKPDDYWIMLALLQT